MRQLWFVDVSMFLISNTMNWFTGRFSAGLTGVVPGLNPNVWLRMSMCCSLAVFCTKLALSTPPQGLAAMTSKL